MMCSSVAVRVELQKGPSCGTRLAAGLLLPFRDLLESPLEALEMSVRDLHGEICQVMMPTCPLHCKSAWTVPARRPRNVAWQQPTSLFPRMELVMRR